jgi:DNA-binding HxlR family transcriptional regulator
MSDEHQLPIADSPLAAPAFTCGLDATLKVISGKWKPLILYFLLRGPTRYGELKRAVRDVSDKMLIQHLKELEADGVLRRNDYKEVPPRVDYTLTPLGESLARALEPLCIWGTENMAEMEKIFVERDSWVRQK